MSSEEKELIIKAQTGNIPAFEELIYKYDKHVLAIAYKYFRNNEDAKDIYQEVFVRVFKGLKNFRFQSEFSTWLYRIAVNVCISQYRVNKKSTFASFEQNDADEYHEFSNQPVANDLTPEELLLANELNIALETALGKLPAKQKMTFVLKHFEGFKIREIAVMMNCKEGTVKKYLFDGIQKLKIHLYEFAK